MSILADSAQNATFTPRTTYFVKKSADISYSSAQIERIAASLRSIPINIQLDGLILNRPDDTVGSAPKTLPDDQSTPTTKQAPQKAANTEIESLDEWLDGIL